MSEFIRLFALLCGAHFLLDYPLQGDFLSKAKNRAAAIPGVPWYQAMTAHCFIQACGVWLLTGSAALGVAEFLIHFATDDAKCNGRISFNQDQAIHIGCKVAWALMAAYLPGTTI